MKKLFYSLFVFSCAIFVRADTLQSKPTAVSPAGDDWLLVQGATNGMRKLSPSYYGTVTSVNGIEPSGGNVTLTPTDLGAATAPTSTTLSGGGPYALTLGPAPYPRYTVAINAATTFTVSGSPNAGDGAIIENTVSGAPRVVTYPTAYRNNAAATSTSVSVSSPRSEFFLKYTGSEYRWSDNEYTADDAASLNYADDTGSANAYAITLSPVPTAYTKGTQYRFKAANANTGAATLNVNGLGTKTIVKYAGGPNTALVANDIRAGQMIICVYDGTYMQMQSTSGNAAAGGGTVLFRSGSASAVISGSTSPTAIFTGTIPAGTLGSSKSVRFFIYGAWLQNAGTAQGFSISISYGGTTIHADSSNATWFSDRGTARNYQINGVLSAAGTTSSQRLNYSFYSGNVLGATTGYGDFSGASTGDPLFVPNAGGTSSVDSTVDQTFTVTITLTSATGNNWYVYDAIAWKLE